MLCGRPPLAAAAGAGLLVRPVGLRALFSIPMGVEEAVIEEILGWSARARRDGTRGELEPSLTGPVAGDSSPNAGGVGIEAKSIESSGALGGASFEGVAMNDDISVSTWGA